MGKTNRVLLSALLICLLSTTAVLAAYQVGDRVNDFTLPDAYGQSVSFSNFAGMVVMINFWTST
ncbi:redoxin domain-containing protein [bacterium]|nr:redoxin domain-containing protein [candidate division CSSED10-310 bacterium]